MRAKKCVSLLLSVCMVAGMLATTGVGASAAEGKVCQLYFDTKEPVFFLARRNRKCYWLGGSYCVDPSLPLYTFLFIWHTTCSILRLIIHRSLY